jgi:hypothetical protein
MQLEAARSQDDEQEPASQKRASLGPTGYVQVGGRADGGFQTTCVHLMHKVPRGSRRRAAGVIGAFESHRSFVQDKEADADAWCS